MPIAFPRLQFTRAGIFILLAVLVALLGAAAKHSQFDEPPHHGYLAKAVKMAGVRINPNLGTQAAQYVTTPVDRQAVDTREELALFTGTVTGRQALSVLSPPLRV